MNAQLTGMIGLAALGLALATPAHAAPDFAEGLIILVKKDRYDDRDIRRDERYDDRRKLRRDDDNDDGQYGTGYERRKQKRDERSDDDDDRRRFRR